MSQVSSRLWFYPMEASKANREARRLLFVYGSLRQGGEAHGLLRAARFLAQVETAPRYATITHAGYPMLVPGRQRIPGEVFAVPSALWSAVDAWEEAPILYRCQPVDLDQALTGRLPLDTVWAYFGNKSAT